MGTIYEYGWDWNLGETQTCLGKGKVYDKKLGVDNGRAFRRISEDDFSRASDERK